MEWLEKYTWKARVAGETDRALCFMRRQGVKDVAALGLCWGLGPVLELALAEKVKCAASVHPSMMVLGMASEKTADDFKKIKVPLWMGPAKDDDPRTFPDGAWVKAINANGG